MKGIQNWRLIMLLALSLGWLMSCNDDVELIDTNHKRIDVSCGGDFEIPVLANNWSIEYVKDASGLNILDKNGNPLALERNGTVEAANGWLALSRNNGEAFVISLKENFDKFYERKFSVCINNEGKRDYVTVIQQTGTEYQIVNSEFEEIEDLRSIYISDKECSSIVLSNPLSTEVWEPTDQIFENVTKTTIFESDDYAAFAWISEEGVHVATPDLIINDTIRGRGYLCLYKEGIAAVPNEIEGVSVKSKTLMSPHSTLYVSGKITYCKRVCNYIFTIQNMGTSTQFKVRGVWTQIIPIANHIIISDK